jgi:carboxylesterase type B
LIAYGGKQDPLFKRAIIMSPAFQPMGDRRLKEGTLEQSFLNVTEWAGCKGQGVACLRKQTTETLDIVNRRLQDVAPQGTFSVGPSADGRWIRQYAETELLEKNVYPVESIIVSNTAHEGYIFVDGHIRDSQAFDNFLVSLFGDVAEKLNIKERVKRYYPTPDPKNPSAKYRNEVTRMLDFIQDAAFACNTRFLAQAYPEKAWSYIWTPLGGWHGTDMVGMYLRAGFKFGNNTIPLTPGLGAFARTFQSYLASYTATGDPNTLSIKTSSPATVPAVSWTKIPAEKLLTQDLGGVLVAGNGSFTMGVNDVAPKDRCTFIQDLLRDVTTATGFAVGSADYKAATPAGGDQPPPATPYEPARGVFRRYFDKGTQLLYGK